MTTDNQILKEYSKRIGERVKTLRKEKHINQQDFAELMGYSKTHMCALENGRKNFTMESILLVAQNLECDVEDLTLDIPEGFGGRIRRDAYKILMDDVTADSYDTIKKVISMAWCKDHPNDSIDERLEQIKQELENYEE